MQRPISQLLGPIFAKEIIEIARRVRYYLCRTTYAVVLLFVMYIAWEEFHAMSRFMGMSNAMARFAGMVFSATSYIQYWSVYLLVPAFLCGVVAGEREEHTLDLLFITPLTDREIVLGKLFSRVAAMVCIILCGVPVLSLIMLFGGVGPESIWRLLAATMLAIFFAGSHAIYFSVITQTPMEAMARTYVALFIWLAGLPLLAWGFREMCRIVLGGIPAELAMYGGPIYLAYPLVSFWGAADDAYHSTLVFIWGSWTWSLSFIGPALWSVLLSWRAIKKLRQAPRPRADWLRWLPGMASLRRRANRPDKVAKRRVRAATSWFGLAVVNPLWLRARLTRVYDRAGAIGRLQWLGWVVVLFSVAMMAIQSPSTLRQDWCAFLFLTPLWGAVALVTALVAGHSLIGDRRRGFLELVAVTPLTGREVVDGSFLAIWEHLRRLLWLPWLLGAFFVLSESTPPLGGLLAVITATLFCTLLACQGVACSLAAKTTAGAVVAAFVLPVTVIIIMPMAVLGHREDHGPALWTSIAVWFVAASLWVWWKPNAASVGGWLTACHLALVAVAECWTRDFRGEPYPMAAMHPVFLVVSSLMKSRTGNQDVWARQGVQIILCYWAALLVNIAFIRWWLARQFDCMVGRTERRRVRRIAEHAAVKKSA